MLTQTDLATLATKLEVPLVVTDILDGKDTLTGDAQYALHELISNYEPDTALLSIAVSAKKIASIYRPVSSSMAVLEIEATRIIEEYGSLWLSNLRNETVDPQDVFDVLIHTTEDLEGLAELLDLNAFYLREKNNTAAALCNILRIQATTQAMIAEAVMDAADAHIEEQSQKASATTQVAKGDNVIRFPVEQRAS